MLRSLNTIRVQCRLVDVRVKACTLPQELSKISGAHDLQIISGSDGVQRHIRANARESVDEVSARQVLVSCDVERFLLQSKAQYSLLQLLQKVA